MASLTLRPLLLLLRQRALRRSPWICSRCLYSTTPPTQQPPPLLLKLRTDLKTAMKAKDTTRLSVLRDLLAEITNSAKTNTPFNTDIQILSLLRKRSASAQAASEEFKAAGRQDLVEREAKQVEVLEEYAGSIETMSADDVRDVVIRTVEESKTQAAGGKVNMGEVLKRLLGPGGALEGKPVEKKEVAGIVKEVLSMS